MHHPVKPGIGPVLPGVLPHLAAVLKIAIAVISLIKAVLKLFIAGARGQQEWYGDHGETSEMDDFHEGDDGGR